MDMTFDTSFFIKAAEACSSADCSVSFVEGENGALGFRIVSSMDDSHAFYGRVIGRISRKLKDHLKSIGYTLSPEPIFSVDSVHFDIWKSSFHGRLADLCEGWFSPDSYLERSITALSDLRANPEASARDLYEVIAMLNAVQSFASQSGSESGSKNPFAGVKHAEAC